MFLKQKENIKIYIYLFIYLNLYLLVNKIYILNIIEILATPIKTIRRKRTTL